MRSQRFAKSLYFNAMSYQAWSYLCFTFVLLWTDLDEFGLVMDTYVDTIEYSVQCLMSQNS